jgi:hypothetical protein
LQEAAPRTISNARNSSRTLKISCGAGLLESGGSAKLHSSLRGYDVMFFRKPKPAICSVCGKIIEARDRRFLEKNRVTKVERHTHIDCHKRAGGARMPPS